MKSHSQSWNGVLAGLAILAAAGRGAEKRDPVPERFFPFGVLASVNECGFLGEPWTRSTARHVRDWKRHYLNTVCAYGMGVPPGGVPRMLQLVKPYGIRVWASLYMPMAYKSEEVRAKCAAFLDTQRDADGILAYTIKDEPKSEHYLPYVASLQFIGRHDPTHPVVSIFSSARSLTPYLPYLEAMSLDCYPIVKRSHDPWYVAMEMAKVRRIACRRPVWFMPQAHSFYAMDYHKMPRRKARREEVPTLPEHRLMTHLALAGGADGLVWFLYRWPPTWHQLKGRGLVNLIEEGGPLWEEIRRQGRTLLPIGPLIAGTCVFSCNGITVATEHEVPMPECIFRVNPPRRKPRPAIAAAVRGHPDRPERFLFLVNNDVTKRRGGTVTLDRAFYPQAHVYDLIDLIEVPLTKNAAFTVEYGPGRGRVYLIGGPAIFSEVETVIQRNRCRGEIGCSTAEVQELTRAGVLSAENKLPALLDRAVRLSLADQPAKARELLRTVRSTLRAAVGARPDYRRRRALLAEAAAFWSDMDSDLDARAVALEYGRKEELQEEIRDMLTLARQYLDFKSALAGDRGAEDGPAVPDTARLATLVEKLKDLKSRLTPKLKTIPAD